jgi:hypothetical protein
MRARARTASTRSSATSAAPRRTRPIRGGAARARRAAADDRAELALAELYRLPTEDDRSVTTLEPGELILELEVPQPEASTYLKAMDRAAGRSRSWAWRRLASRTAPARAGGVAPIPWLPRLAGRARQRDAASRHGVQGRAGAPADPRERSTRRLMVWPSSSLRERPSGSDRRSRTAARAGTRARAASGRRRRLVVLGAHEVETSAPVVHCPDWQRGPGASLRCGLAALGQDAQAAVVVARGRPEPLAGGRRPRDRSLERAGAGRSSPPRTTAQGCTPSCSTAASGPDPGRGRPHPRRRPRLLRRSRTSRRRRSRR